MRFSELYHANSRKMRTYGRREFWPESWTTVVYKAYPALKKKTLPNNLVDGPVTKILKKRQSKRSFSKELPLQCSQLGQVVVSSLGALPFGISSQDDQGQKPLHRRPYPSAGARFPLETYLLVFNVEDLDPGLYHYSPADNSVTFLNDGANVFKYLLEIVGFQWVVNAGALIILSAVFERAMEKYEEKGYRLALLEAGHAGQNICLMAEEVGLKCCPLALKDETKLNESIGIDGITEGVVHALALGV